MKVLIASDHAGYELKEALKEAFANDFEWVDYGTFSTESVDYPDFAHKLATDVANGSYQYGVLICGTGNGMAMSANKHAGIRAGLCWSKEIAALVRQHNNANILVMPARFIPFETASEIVKTFFSTDFEGGRHQRRIDKINL
ncbi:MAG: ribose 5-phosphate isomerase B [Alphaproteobacteria bacterium]|nr:ribose 5-phosphate isomerase B [Alphaproteobacteria bacterium]